LLKYKADEITINAAPLPPPPSSPTPVAKHPRRDRELMDQMCRLLRVGVWWLDMLRGAQMAAQEASGVMAVAILWKQGAMREVSAWETEVEGMMREMVRRVEGEDSDL